MKRIVGIIMILVWIVGVCGCGKEKAQGKDLFFYIREDKVNDLKIPYLQVCGMGDVSIETKMNEEMACISKELTELLGEDTIATMDVPVIRFLNDYYLSYTQAYTLDIQNDIVKNEICVIFDLDKGRRIYIEDLLDDTESVLHVFMEESGLTLSEWQNIWEACNQSEGMYGLHPRPTFMVVEKPGVYLTDGAIIIGDDRRLEQEYRISFEMLEEYLVYDIEHFRDTKEYDDLHTLEICETDDGIISIDGLWDEEVESSINQYLAVLSREMEAIYDEEPDSFLNCKIQYVSENYLSVQCELVLRYYESDYDIIRQGIVFDLATGERVFLNELISKEQCLEELENPKNAIALDENADYLYTMGVRERLGNMSSDRITENIMACCMSESDWLKGDDYLGNKASFGLYEGKLLFYFPRVEVFYVDEYVE